MQRVCKLRMRIEVVETQADGVEKFRSGAVHATSIWVTALGGMFADECRSNSSAEGDIVSSLMSERDEDTKI